MYTLNSGGNPAARAIWVRLEITSVMGFAGSWSLPTKKKQVLSFCNMHGLHCRHGLENGAGRVADLACAISRSH